MKNIPCPIYTHASSVDKLRVAIQFQDHTVSYQELNFDVQVTADQLRRLKIRRYSRVALLAGRSYDFIVYYFALLRLQATPCLLNPQLTPAQLKKYTQQLKVKYLIEGERRLRILPDVRHIREKDIQCTALNLELKVVNDFSAQQTADIMLTSGSTGQPKAVVHSVGNHYYSALGSNEHVPFNRQNKWLLSLPTFHVSGLSVLWRAFVAAGTVSIGGADQELFEHIRELQPTHLSVVPVQLQRLIANPRHRQYLKKMKAILIGGSGVSERLKEEIIEHRLPAYISYGLTEMSSQVATTRKIRSVKDLNSAVVLKYRKVRIDAQQNICVKGETLFKGYEMNGRIQRKTDRQGYFRTGDLGRVSLLKYLRVLGRADTMFISGGENIYPEEIERSMLNMPQIQAVVVLPIKDRTYGYRPIALIKVAPQKSVSAKRIRQYLTKQLERFKVPDNYYLWPNNKALQQFKVCRAELAKYVKNNRRKLVELD